MIRADGQIKALALRRIYKDKVPEAANEGQTFTILIKGSGFEGHWLKEDVGITIPLKMEMPFANKLTAAFVTGMKNKLCGVSHLRWGGDGPRDAPEPRASPMPVEAISCHIGEPGEPQHSLLSAGEETLPRELSGVSSSRAAAAEKMRWEGQDGEWPKAADPAAFHGWCCQSSNTLRAQGLTAQALLIPNTH